jgi:hypothetical protein
MEGGRQQEDGAGANSGDGGAQRVLLLLLQADLRLPFALHPLVWADHCCLIGLPSL